MGKEERDKLIRMLRGFKRSRNIDELKEIMNSVESEECRKVLMETMSPYLREKLQS
jgi:sugar diacid utilization regulator